VTKGQAWLPEFDVEMARTRRYLEHLPEDKLGWKPHPQSLALGQLASFLAFLQSWWHAAIVRDELDLLEPPSPPAGAPLSRQALLDAFDLHVANGRHALAAVSDERLMEPWTLKSGEKEVFRQPRIAVLRGAVLNHTIRHRTRLGVYLRLLEIPVPSLYEGLSESDGEKNPQSPRS
jgi:uncharacterized damage-inducible protein DinB